LEYGTVGCFDGRECFGALSQFHPEDLEGVKVYAKSPVATDKPQPKKIASLCDFKQFVDDVVLHFERERLHCQMVGCLDKQRKRRLSAPSQISKRFSNM
jgi:hypothetical protein